MNALPEVPPSTIISPLDAALSYAARGWPVFPVFSIRDGRCSCGKDGCAHPGKHPMVRDWPNVATTDEATIRAWWSETPDASVAIVTGRRSKLLVIDVDPRNGGEDSMEMLVALNGVLPHTPEVLTGGRGRHLYFAHPGVDTRHDGLGAGIDVQGDGRYVVAPPSSHVLGRVYEWGVTGVPDDVPLAELPGWLLERLTKLTKPEAEPARARPTLVPGSTIPEGERNQTLTQLGGSMRKRGMTRDEILAALRTVNQQRCQPSLPDAEVEGIAASVARYAPGDVPVEDIALTDIGNARRLIALHGGDLRYSVARGRWLYWDDRRWALDECGEVERRAKETVTDLYLQTAVADGAARDRLGAHARRSSSAARLHAMVSLAQSEPGVSLPAARLDADPFQLNVLNGTVDLRTGQRRDHDRGDCITKLAPVIYDPEARCPTWLAFLDKIMAGDAALIAFLQRALGYTLTGSTKEQVYFLLYGSGANGKSTLLNTVHAVLGEYGTNTMTETFLRKREDAIPNDVAALKGARFVTAVEADGGRRLAEARVKQLTGGDPVTARHLHQEFFTFVPEFKLFLAANHKPRVTGTDHAMWRRTKLIPFTITIRDADQDRHLGDKLRGELSGILTWMVQGCMAWHKSGLGDAPAVKQATEGYRAEQDLVAVFLDERCQTGPALRISKAELYDAYQSWCAKSGEQWLTKNELGARLAERGISDGRGKSGSVRLWRGLGLLPPEEREEGDTGTQT